jgi:hypothetical protein
MRKLCILFLALSFLSFIPKTETNQFVGRWTGEDNGDIGYMVFDAEGYAPFEIKGQVFGGKEFTLQGKKGSMMYEINNTTKPIEVDFIVTQLETGEQKRMLCIAKFTDANNMRFAMGFNNTRPTEFTELNAIRLKREK